jgi:thymidine kinase
VIKYDKDTRSGPTTTSTHDKLEISADISCSRLSDIKMDTLSLASVIAIDEGQFFPDLPQFCEKMANMGMTCIVSALDGTFERQPFPDVVRLIPLAETVVKLNSVCMVCHKSASFTRRIVSERKVEMIGGSDIYEAVCRGCHTIPEPVVASPITPGAIVSAIVSEKPPIAS